MSKRHLLRGLLDKEPELGANQKEQLLASYIERDNAVINNGDNSAINNEEDSTIKNNDTSNIDSNIDSKITVDVDIDKLIKSNKNKIKKKPYVGIYLDDDVNKVLKKIQEKGGKGILSDLANQALRKLFIEQGYLK